MIWRLLHTGREREWSEQSVVQSTGANGTARSQTALKPETQTQSRARGGGENVH